MGGIFSICVKVISNLFKISNMVLCLNIALQQVSASFWRFGSIDFRCMVFFSVNSSWNCYARMWFCISDFECLPRYCRTLLALRAFARILKDESLLKMALKWVWCKKISVTFVWIKLYYIVAIFESTWDNFILKNTLIFIEYRESFVTFLFSKTYSGENF